MHLRRRARSAIVLIVALAHVARATAYQSPFRRHLLEGPASLMHKFGAPPGEPQTSCVVKPYRSTCTLGLNWDVMCAHRVDVGSSTDPTECICTHCPTTCADVNGVTDSADFADGHSRHVH